MRRIVEGLDVGLRREKNEDFVLVDPTLRLGIVADGVGGHRGGDRAARLVAQTVHQMLKDQSWVIERIRGGDRSIDPEDLAKVARYAVNRASQLIHREAQEDLELRGMSTTCTLLVDLGNRGLVAHVGDSRAYIARSGQVLRVTEDHVVAVAGGKEVAGKPMKQRVLSRAVGHAPECQVDVMWVELRPSDVILLCSDGLSDQLSSDEEVGEVLEAFGPEASPEVFVDLANVRGGPDNIGLVVFGPEEGTQDIPEPRTPWAETKAQLQVLRNLQPFAALSYFELELLRPHVRVDVYPAGAKVVVDSSALAVVARGLLEIQSRDVCFEVQPGGVLGETSLTSQKPWPYDVSVKEQAVLLVLPTSALVSFVAERPFASSRLLWTLLSCASERYCALAKPSADVGSHAPVDVRPPPSPEPISSTVSLPPPEAEAPKVEAPKVEAEAPAEVAPATQPAPLPQEEEPSLAAAFTPPSPQPKAALKLPPMPPIGSPIVSPSLPPEETAHAPEPEEEKPALEAAPVADDASEEESTDPWGHDPVDIEAPVPSVAPVPGLTPSTRSLFDEGGQSHTLPPPPMAKTEDGDEEERHTLPPPAHRRPTDPPPEDKPT